MEPDMKDRPLSFRLVMCRPVLWLACAGFCLNAAAAQAQTVPATSDAQALYRAIQSFELTGGTARVDNLTLKRDRAQMTFTGSFYFAAPANGRVTGAVFVGLGTFRADVPPSRFEQDNLRRLLRADVVESDFKTAVLRFSDDTFDIIGKSAAAGQAPPDALKLASEFEERVRREVGANIAARLALSLLNDERPGVFMAEFDKGRRNRFTCLLDFQARIPVAHFGLNGGEKGLIYTHKADYYSNDVWMTFYALDDYAKGSVTYSDTFNLVAVDHYAFDVDLRDAKNAFGYTARIDLKALAGPLRAVPFVLSESLSAQSDTRLKRGLRIKSAKLVGGGAVQFVQEPWEGGFTLLLPAPVVKDERLAVEVRIEGDFMREIEGAHGNFYPLSNECWYPRHGYLVRSTFGLTFRHNKNVKVAAVGTRVREEPVAGSTTSEMVTEFTLDVPVVLASFAVGPFERRVETNEMKGRPPLPVEFYSMPISIQVVETAFVLAEMKNSINFFSALFGQYPFPVFRATVHPFGFGQGLPTMLMIPKADQADQNTFSFISHETSHQWWGHIVLWRSYRDQWLSEGFARYSGLLYTGRRDRPESVKEMLKEMRESLRLPPATALGMGSGRLTDVGPLTMGHRLATRETADAYQALIYNKGGLVLRMLHFLFSDPATGADQPFYDMMSDFTRRFAGRSASTDDFRAVAAEHFVKTRVAQKFGLGDLDWFFQQWVFSTALPSYRLEYSIEPDGDAFMIKGTVFQDGIPAGENWFTPLPLVVRLGGDKVGRVLVYAMGPETPVNLRIGSKPKSIDLDPEMWILSEKTTTKAVK
jgi:hypothetical protein